MPITVFRKTETDEIIPNATWAHSAELVSRIETAFAEKGADAWFADGVKERFLAGLVPKAEMAAWEKVATCSTSGSIPARRMRSCSKIQLRFRDFGHLARSLVKGGQDRVMYLEGSDQHRGWFQSSLLESCGTRGHAPYDIVLTHGFVLDEKGQKMSKSLGNVVAPQDVMAKSGADILRLWVAASDYSDDLRIGPEILKTFSETYRKLRNTMRWMLGALAHFIAAPIARGLPDADMKPRAGAADAASAGGTRSRHPPGV